MIYFVKWVVRFKRILKNGLYFSSKTQTFLACKFCKIFATIKHFACVGYVTTQKKSSQSGFTAPTFAGYSGNGRFIFIN